MEASLLELFKKRAPWLVVLFLGELITANVIGHFEHELQRAVVLALFIPLITSSGGNSGSQASTLIIRAMALGELTLDDWWRVMRKEIASGLALGTLLGGLGLVRVLIAGHFAPEVYGPHLGLIGATLATTILAVVLWGSLCGSMLPLLLRRLGLDPATSSAPFVATLVDVTGLVIYFGAAVFILRGTVL
jgi:magnesium transporter